MTGPEVLGRGRRVFADVRTPVKFGEFYRVSAREGATALVLLAHDETARYVLHDGEDLLLQALVDPTIARSLDVPDAARLRWVVVESPARRPERPRSFWTHARSVV